MVGVWCFGCCQVSWVYQFDFFCSGIQFYVLLSHYLCFISFLYLEFYVLRDDAWISQGFFMQTKHLCFLIRISTKGEVCAPWNWLKPPVKYFYLPFQRGTFLWIICVIYVLCLSCFRICSLVPCGHLLGKDWPLGSRLRCLTVFFVTFPCGILSQVWYLIVPIPDLWKLSYFYWCQKWPCDVA